MVRVDATVCAPGVYTYYDAGGKAVREYVPPEEIARADSLASLEDATVTNRHPRSMVDPSTWQSVAIGHARGGRSDDGKAVATLVITSGQAQGEIGKSLIEVSRGVNVRIDETPGVTPQGERYDRVQRDITYNHIALGPQGWGRQGAGVSLRLDAAGDELREDTEAKEQTMKIKIRGTEYEYKNDSELQALVDKHAVNDGANPFAKKGEEDDEDDKKKAKKDEAEREALKARADSAERELQIRKDADAKASREALLVKARKVLGAEYKADSAAKDRDIQVAVLAKLQPEVKYDSRADAYVEASFDIAIEAPSNAGSRQDSIAAGLLGLRQDGTRIDESDKPAARKDHRGEMIRKDSERAKKPLGSEYFGK